MFFSHRPKIDSRNFVSIAKKSFFLKYLKRKGLVSIIPTSVTKKNEAVDFKDLLDETKIRLTYYDLLKDYKYFRLEYYYIDIKTQEGDPRRSKVFIPSKINFDAKSMTLPQVLLHGLVPVFLN
jgi:hypothetical protein